MLVSMDAIDLIRELRRLGLSQQTIAARCGLSQGAISHIETGRRKNVFATTRDKLAALLKAEKSAPSAGQTKHAKAQGAGYQSSGAVAKENA